MLKKYLLLIFISSLLNLFSQQTGSFQKDISFNSTNHYSAYYVPTNYNSNQKHPLIVALHGCGGNANSFRNDLITMSDSLDAIILCPDMMGGRFEDTLGLLIVNAIDSTINSYNYNIDSNAIYLTGFSCNGRETFRQAWSDLYPFTGIIPFNSWIPSIDNTYNFESKIPTCICSGDNDPSYNNNTILYDSLISNDGYGKFVSMPGIGHQWGFSSQDMELMKCFNWIDSLKSYFNDTMTIDTTLSIFTAERNLIQFNLFPNPSSEIINLEFKEMLSYETIDVKIINIDGKNVYSASFESIESIELNLPNLSSGLYIMNIESNSNQIAVKKFSIKR